MPKSTFSSQPLGSIRQGCHCKIPVSELRIGMHVTGLDRDWLETPFALQGFYIRSVEDIQKVTEYCRHVWIEGKDAPIFDTDVDFTSGKLIGRTPVQHPITSSVEEEHQRARDLVGDMRGFAARLIDDVRFGHAIDTPGAKRLVTRTVESILRHPEALLWMTRMREQSAYTAEHLLNVCILSIAFGRRLGLKKQQLQNIGLCGLLHDVGKAQVPLEILNKPGPLTHEERAIMRGHVAIGRDLLVRERSMLQSAIDVAYGHHERSDGLGYPQRVSARSLPLFTRIISIVDAFDAITGERAYATARPSTEALRIIYEERGTQFDSDLALAFIQTIGPYPPGSLVELASGAVGVVVETHPRYRHLPRIMMLLDADKKPDVKTLVNLTDIEDGLLPKEYFIRRVLKDGSHGIRLQDLYDKGEIAALAANPSVRD